MRTSPTGRPAPRLLAVAVVVVALLAGGCSSKTKSSTTKDSATTTTSTVAGTTTTTTASASGDTSSSGTTSSDTTSSDTSSATSVPADLKGRLLGASDLPGSGWKAQKPSASSDSGDDCAKGDPTAAPFKDLASSGEVDFDKGSSQLAFVAEKLGVDSEGNVKAAFDKLKKAIDGCVGKPLGDSGGGGGTIAHKSLTVDADASAAWEATIGDPTSTDTTKGYRFDFVAFRKGDALVLIGYGPAKAGDAELKAVVAAALGKL